MGRSALVPEEELADAPPAVRHKEKVPDRTIWCLDLRSQDGAGPYLAEIGRLAGVELAPQPVPGGDVGYRGGVLPTCARVRGRMTAAYATA
jgi:hypothetical protein